MREINQGGYVYARSSHISPEFNQNGITRRNKLADDIAVQSFAALDHVIFDSWSDDDGPSTEFLAEIQNMICKTAYKRADLIIAAGKKGCE